MQLSSSNQKNHILLTCFIVIGFFVVGNSFGLNEYPMIDDFYFVDLFLLGSSIVLVSVMVPTLLHFRKTSHDVSWILFLIVAVLWMIGEGLWSYDFEYDVGNPLSYIADIFWLAAYPFLLGFEILYLKPFRKAISKKILVTSITLALPIMIPCIIMAIEMDMWDFESIILFSYSVLDVMVLAPAIIGMILFFRGRVSGIWNLMLLGIIFDSIANLWYSFEISESLYGPGDYVDLLYVCGYIVFSFGVWNNIKMFQKTKMKQNFAI